MQGAGSFSPEASAGHPRTPAPHALSPVPRCIVHMTLLAARAPALRGGPPGPRGAGLWGAERSGPEPCLAVLCRVREQIKIPSHGRQVRGAKLIRHLQLPGRGQRAGLGPGTSHCPAPTRGPGRPTLRGLSHPSGSGDPRYGTASAALVRAPLHSAAIHPSVARGGAARGGRVGTRCRVRPFPGPGASLPRDPCRGQGRAQQGWGGGGHGQGTPGLSTPQLSAAPLLGWGH